MGCAAPRWHLRSLLPHLLELGTYFGVLGLGPHEFSLLAPWLSAQYKSTKTHTGHRVAALCKASQRSFCSVWLPAWVAGFFFPLPSPSPVVLVNYFHSP
jgi:hypothetical protein